MNDNNFVQLIALKAGLTNEEAETFLKGFVNVFGEKIKEAPLIVEGLGSFELVDNIMNFIPDKELIESVAR